MTTQNEDAAKGGKPVATPDKTVTPSDVLKAQDRRATNLRRR